MGFSLGNLLGRGIDLVGSTFNLPELGISEKLGVHSTGNVFGDQSNPYTVGNVVNNSHFGPASTGGGGGSGGAGVNTGGAGVRAGGGGGGGSAASAQGIADSLAFLSDQAAQLRSLLGRADTQLNQGLTRNEDQYNTEVGNATTQKTGLVNDQKKAKVDAYNTIDRNAGTGLKSLQQIIGRASGTGSSAYQQLLPDVVGKDTSSKRFNATGTYDGNLSKIDASFQNVLSDLLKQKKSNEESLRSGIEGQRQNINSQLAQNAAQQAQAKGGGYAQVKAAQAPFQQNIENSRNQVENFFNQFRTQYTPQAVEADVNPYNTDRTAVNAQQQPGADPNNPYSALLRRKLQEQQV